MLDSGATYVAAAVPPVPDASLHVIVLKSLCTFAPHHRITAKRNNQLTLQVDVCFDCSEMRFGTGSVRLFPLFWRRRLLSLFERCGLPNRDYAALRDLPNS